MEELDLKEILKIFYDKKVLSKVPGAVTVTEILS